MLNIDIEKNGNGNELTFLLTGRLDTTTAPELEEQLKKEIDGVEELVFDFADLEYISSAGLRVLLSAQKIMNKQGSMKVINSSEEINEIFEVTGFSDILTIE
ncbi:MAG: STAS domain-containing protein [Lachnospiraceae bacterium]|nr:STAS domain-containing protein [Lachnospiraceae bacterium]MBR6273806.1 STAS domain-containing protein [Lachnospiraceae bacterium]